MSTEVGGLSEEKEPPSFLWPGHLMLPYEVSSSTTEEANSKYQYYCGEGGTRVAHLRGGIAITTIECAHCPLPQTLTDDFLQIKLCYLDRSTVD